MPLSRSSGNQEMSLFRMKLPPHSRAREGRREGGGGGGDGVMMPDDTVP